MNIRLLGLVALWSHSVAAGLVDPPEIFTVGPSNGGPACNYTNIQAAIDAAQ